MCNALVLYDYVLNISDEIQHVWKRRLSSVTILYVLNRYGLCFYRMLMTTEFVSFGPISEAQADLVHIASISTYPVLLFLLSCCLTGVRSIQNE